MVKYYFSNSKAKRGSYWLTVRAGFVVRDVYTLYKLGLLLFSSPCISREVEK